MITLNDLAGQLTCSVEEAAEALGIGRSAGYAQVREGAIPSLRLGRSIRVSVPKLLELVGANPRHTETGPSQDPATATDSHDDLTAPGAHDEDAPQRAITSSNVRQLRTT